MKLNEKMLLKELIEQLMEVYASGGDKGLYSDENWALYTSDFDFCSNTECLIAEPIDIDDDTDEEIFPESAEENDMTIHTSCEVLNDTIVNVLSSAPDSSAEKIIDVLKYYLENDTFPCNGI